MTEENKKRKAIVVGANSSCCESIGWHELPTRNFVDYDLVVLLLRELSKLSSVVTYEMLAVMNIALGRQLKSGGRLIVVVSSAELFQLRHSEVNPTATNVVPANIIPIGINITSEPGNTVEHVNLEEFGKYLRKIKSWSFWASITGPGAVENQFLRNREGKTLAGYFGLGTIGVTLLPDVVSMSLDDVAAELLTELGFIQEAEQPPDWAQEISVPGAAEIEASITKCRQEIASAGERLLTFNQELDALERYKALVFSTGDQLESVVADVMQRLGATMLDERHGVEDSLLRIQDQTCVVEVTGTDGPLKLLKVRQLLDHAMIVEDKTEERPKAILIANALRKVPLDMRPTSKTPEFPPNIVTRAEESKIAIVPGSWLLARFCEVLQGDLTRQSVLDEILNTDGLVS